VTRLAAPTHHVAHQAAINSTFAALNSDPTLVGTDGRRPAQLTLTGTEGAAMSTKHPCERCGTRFARRNERTSPLCAGCRQRRATARHRAEGRARHWLAAQHPEQYANLYADHLARARTQDAAGSAAVRARARALGELQRSYRDDYQQRYAAELARAQAALDQQARQEYAASARPAEPRVPYWQERDALAQQHAHARLRVLLWLADRYPDSTAAIYQAQAARVPLNPAERSPARRCELAWARTLDHLGRLHPDDFQARYRTELTSGRTASQ
jgi:hypothetical protein